MNTILSHIFNAASIVSTAIVFGIDTFFALVGKKAAARSKDRSIADLMGHFHAIADARMPLIGASALLTTLAQLILAGLHNTAGQLALLSLIALLAHLIVYLTIARPVNEIMVQGIKFGRMVDNIRDLQRRWDKVIELRAALLFIAIISLILINYC